MDKARDVLKRKRLNGDIVGRSIVVSRINSYINDKNSKNAQDILSEDENVYLVSKLSIKEEMEKYYDYFHLVYFIDHMQTRISLIVQKLYSDYLKMYMRAIDIIQGEEIKRIFDIMPMIMNENEYKLYKLRTNVRCANIAELTFFVLAKFLHEYISDKTKKNPLKQQFERYNKESITNKRLIDIGLICSKYQVLTNHIEVYEPYPIGTKSNYYEFVEDYKDLYEDIMKEIYSKKKLAFIKDLTIEDQLITQDDIEEILMKYSDEELEQDINKEIKQIVKKMEKIEFDSRILIKYNYFDANNIGYKAFVNRSYKGVAVMDSDESPKEHYKTYDESMYIARGLYEDSIIKNYSISNTYNNMKEQISNNYSDILIHLKEYYSYSLIYQRINELLDIPQIMDIIQPLDMLEPIESAITLTRIAELTAEKKEKQMLYELFPEIDFDKAKPTNEAICKFKEEVTDIKAFKININKYLNILNGGLVGRE